MQRPKRTHRTSVVGYSERLSREPRQSSRSASSPRRSRPRVRVPRVRACARPRRRPDRGRPVRATGAAGRSIQGVDAHQGACLFVSRALLVFVNMLASLLGVRARSGCSAGCNGPQGQARRRTADADGGPLTGLRAFGGLVLVRGEPGPGRRERIVRSIPYRGYVWQ